ncbi:MAG TPA: glycosyltransferase [Polyangiales bacterium]|nr:glycosyltransferase [Polyangiales bacterium]
MPASTPSSLEVSVVLPTYNESESLPVIVPRIAETLKNAGIVGEIIIVDDNSPDGTAEVGQKLAEEYPVRVHKRVTERGLATAVLAGFGLSTAKVCVVMDADGSHPVDALPQMVKIILEDKADVVVGSRHVPGGGSKDWPLFSQFKSKLAATLALGVTSMTDPTTGFLAARRNLLERLDLDPVGWKIVLEIVVKAAPVRLAEVPIIFVDRELGVSKQSLGVFGEYLAHLAKLYSYRYPALSELVKFCAVGVLGMCVDLASVITLKENWNLDTRLCAVFGFIVAVTSNFFLNRKYTFARARELPLLYSYITYVGTNLAGLAVRMLTIQALIAMAGMDQGRNYVFTNLIGILLATLVNFVGAKFFAFDPQRVDVPTDEPDARTGRPSSLPPQTRNWGMAALAAVTLGYAFVSGVPWAQLTSPNEGVNVTMARNIHESSQFFTRPSVFPGGRTDWLKDDVPALGNLPTYPALLAPMTAFSGFAGMALISFLAWCITVYATSRLVSLVDPKAGLYTAILMLTAPALLLSFRRIEFEPILTALCAAGSYQVVRGIWQRQRFRCLIGGALLGLGFITKMWLIVPYAFAMISFCVGEAASVRSSGQSAGLRKSVIVGGVGFAITASAHLLYVAFVSPADLPVWIQQVYFGIFSGKGITGGKLSALADYARHERSALYYPLVLYRDHFVLLPLCMYGIGEVLRVPQVRRRRLLAMIGGGLIAIVALSVPAYKDARYVLAATPFMYAFAGICLSAFARSPDKLRPATVSVVRLSMVLATLAFLVVLGVYLADAPVKISGVYVLAHAAGTALCLLLGQLWMRTQWVTRQLGILALIGLAGFAIVYPRVDETPPYAAIARVLAPHLKDAEPAYPSYVASGCNELRGYTERTGLCFGDLVHERTPAQEDPRLKAFVFGPGPTPDSAHALYDWAEHHARDITEELVREAGSDLGYRILVR